LKEVSCRTLQMFFRQLRVDNVPEARLLAGVPYSSEHLKDRHERIDWSAFTRFMENAGALWTEDQLIEIGAGLFRNPFLLPMKLIGRLLFTAKDFYTWVNSTSGNQFFTCVDATWREIGDNRIVTELRIKDGYEPCRGFFLVTKGGLACFPNVLSLRSAAVTMMVSERSATYDVTFPAGGGVLAWLRKAIAWPFTVKAVARELKDAHTQLLARYGELDSARRTLALQATQLRTAHSISQVIHRDLDLDRTIAAVAEALVEVGQFARVEVAIAWELEGRTIERTVSAGEAASGAEPIQLPLQGRGGKIGDLTLWPGGKISRGEQLELLDHVTSAISVTVDDALTFTALSDYRQHLEDRVADRTSDLRAAGAALTETLARLQEAQRGRDKIFANVNHEIRTPLSLIKLAVADLRVGLAGQLCATSHEDLTIISGAVGKLLRLVDDLLLLAAAEEHKLEVRLAPCDVAGVVAGVVRTFQAVAASDSLQLRYRGPTRAVMEVDESAIERIIANLVSNAVKFTPAGGQVEVEVEDRNATLEISVRDNGIGIDDEFKTRIFGRFEQGRPSLRRGVRGSGLGLSLVKELASAHGGTIEVESPRGGGTLFRVTLPRRERQRGELPAAGPVAVALQPSDFGLEERHGEVEPILEPHTRQVLGTILIAEDDVTLAAALARLLSRQYRVIQAHDGMAALRLAEEHLPDALVSDLDMPGMDGLELARRFRQIAGNRLAPVLMLTAFVQIADRLAGFEAGVVDYIAKPFNPDELLARLRSQLAVRGLALRLHQSEQLAALGTLSAGLAHELRNPVNAIVNALEPLRRQLPAELVAEGTAAGELLEVLQDCAVGVARLTRQLLGFSRPGEIEREPVAVAALLQRALFLAAPALEGVEVKPALEFEGEVNCSGPLVVQVLANLLCNAGHAAQRRGWVRIASRQLDDHLVLEVSDSGSGVPAELREKIFEPFFTTKPPGVGTGLGLYTARQIAEQHGGNLMVCGGPGQTIFHLELPLVSVAMAAAPPASARARR
jgi:signal transduction histidine kinase